MRRSRKNLPADSPSLPDACAALKVSWGVGWRMLLTGRLNGFKDGRNKWRVTRASLERALAAQKAESTPTGRLEGWVTPAGG
jgi:hypothetical protein